MKKPIIGIFPISNYLLTEDSFADTYRYGNNYIKKIIENNAIPLLIPLNNNEIIPETLDLCDGLLIPGGNRILPVTLQTIDYFYKHKKPILGICLGMQALGMYSVNIEEPKTILKKIDNGVDHWPVEITRENPDIVVHNINIKKDTILYNIIKKEKTMVNSVHKSTITQVGDKFIVSALSDDKLIEAIECKDKDNFILGVQFHPEVLPQFNNIFQEFINKCQNNNK